MFTQEQIERANVIISRCFPGSQPFRVIPQKATDGTLVQCLFSGDLSYHEQQLSYMLAIVEDDEEPTGKTFAVIREDEDICELSYAETSPLFDIAFKALLRLEFEERAEQAQFEYDALTVRATAG